ncbi:hypothetical protein, partial [Vibrio harveyi]|uniref:hypothetical protein n=1 Tax=Vibrio harveyi TaxID=669 RepID=UPI003BB7F641|nr:hypothetical protein [Vibrio parahaemolyticus]
GGVAVGCARWIGVCAQRGQVMPVIYLGVAGLTLGFLTAKEINKSAWLIVVILALIIWMKMG